MPRVLFTGLLCALAAGCAQEVSVNVRGGDRPPDPGYLQVASGVDVDRFQIVLRNLRLQESPTDGGVESPGVARIGPGAYLVDLPAQRLTGGTFTEVVKNFPIGAKGFYEMDIDLSPVTQADVQAAPELGTILGKTFVIQGHNAQNVPFTFDSTMSRVLVRPSVFRMGLNHNNLDVNIEANKWFVNPAGGFLDPVSNDPAVRAQIEANVAASIDAYEDDDMNGVPDPLG